MNNIVAIKNKGVASSSIEKSSFLNPDAIYVPIDEGLEIMYKSHTYINKNQAVLKGKYNAFSPISGTILGISESLKVADKPVKCLVIENDFKEKVFKKRGIKKYINNYTEEELKDILERYQVASPIPNNIDLIVINGIEQDPFEHTRSYIINNFSAALLETIDALSSILQVSNVIFALNSNDADNVTNISNNIGTYPNIKLKLMPNVYPIGYKEILLRNLISRKEENYWYLDVQDIYKIYTVLKKQKPVTEKFITLAGDALKKSMVVEVKLGTSINDIINNCCELKKVQYFAIYNGLIAGKTLKTLNNVVDKNTNSIFLNTQDKTLEKRCINCGLCASKCPVGLNPKYLREHPKADRSKCINCGLCSYICPANINFKPYLGGQDEQ